MSIMMSEVEGFSEFKAAIQRMDLSNIIVGESSPFVRLDVLQRGRISLVQNGTNDAVSDERCLIKSFTQELSPRRAPFYDKDESVDETLSHLDINDRRNGCNFNYDEVVVLVHLC